MNSKNRGGIPAQFVAMTPIPVSGAPSLVNLIRNKVKAGFPSPAEDLGVVRLDLTKLIGADEEDAYFMWVSGDSMIQFGIFDGDLVLIRKRKRPRHGQIVIACLDRDFLVKKLYKKPDGTRLQAGNPEVPDIVLQEGQTLEVWGVVTNTVRMFKA
jgi:DNA polymerase V